MIDKIREVSKLSDEEILGLFSKRILSVMEEEGMGKAAFAKKLQEAGGSSERDLENFQIVVTNWLNKGFPPTFAVLPRISKALGVSLDYLFGLSGNKIKSF